jgi:large subunit ribosomal protein L24
MSKWIRKGDKVVVIAGNEKGKTGTVLSRTEERVVIQGINIRKKHLKRKTKTPNSDIIEMEMPLHISNISVCDAEGKPVKLKVKIATSKSKEKELVYLDAGKEVVYRQVNKKN